MTQKFKFGDRVIDKAFGLGECVVINTFEDCVHIRNEQGGYNLAAKADSLELIPHPDTVRLDWLADKNNNMGSVLLPTACVENHLDSLRDAIDEAMKMDDLPVKSTAVSGFNQRIYL